MNEKKYFEFLSWYLNGVEQKRYNLHKILPQDAVKLYIELKQPQVINSVCKCPLCGEKMINKETSKTDKDMQYKPILASDAYLIKREIYNNAISCKFDNRRVTVIKHDDGFEFEFTVIDHDYTPHAFCKCVHGKVAVTYINISKESAEILMFNLAELMGFRICR